METNKPYLNPTLTIQELAAQIETSLHKLSQVLNQKMGSNFTDYVNRYRVEESKKLLRNPKSMYAIDGDRLRVWVQFKNHLLQSLQKTNRLDSFGI
jgi:AraC-like DNA-binding protein